MDPSIAAAELVARGANVIFADLTSNCCSFGAANFEMTGNPRRVLVSCDPVSESADEPEQPVTPVRRASFLGSIGPRPIFFAFEGAPQVSISRQLSLASSKPRSVRRTAAPFVAGPMTLSRAV